MSFSIHQFQLELSNAAKNVIFLAQLKSSKKDLRVAVVLLSPSPFFFFFCIEDGEVSGQWVGMVPKSARWGVLCEGVGGVLLNYGPLIRPSAHELCLDLALDTVFYWQHSGGH